MLDVSGKLRDDFPSVSKLMKYFYTEFDSEGISFRKANGDPYEQQRLLEEWAAAGTYSTNMGSRVHFLLEKHTLEEFGISKEVRQPIYECDAEQIVKGDTMVVAGKQYIDLGHYNTQLPFYGKLLLKMLEGTKYENIKLMGCIVVLLTEEREYVEHRVLKKTINTILEMDMKKYLTK